uniref:Uncharacterized protein K02A2.6-like n=1 Tax=Saccoglossus kowalevskii TaxID=10224 RepID=A0ABM0MIF6_SACKO|nr:PREDICTED: uncharacterized protein K02A2.6-like [Saccoglossus kowalevskii]
MDKLVFMGMLLSEKGIGPTEDRVKAVMNAREPENIAELRSFMGLVTYSSRFIPQFATLGEPLRKLTRKDTPFKFGTEQKSAFRALKESLARACTLAYFAKDAPTKVIADASPVRLGAVLVQEQAALTTQEVEEASSTDDELTELREAIQTGRFVKCKQFAPIAGELCIIGKLVFRGTRIVMPNTLRPRTLALAHEGHLGVVGTKQNLRSKVWWPAMDKAAEKYCRACHGCQLVARPDPPEPLRPTQLPNGPWQDIAIDSLGPFPSGHSILVVVDYYSRYYEYDILTSTVTEKLIDSLEEIFSRHGLPRTIKSDNGPQFRSDEFREYCEHNGVVHQKVTARWAQANGEVERQNKSLMKRICIAQAEGLNWRKELRSM